MLRYWRHWAAVLVCLAATATAYWPGLSGGYLFDDVPNIVDNTDVHVTTLDPQSWRAAALSSPSPELRRPLAMLSFAANYYYTRLDPFPMKGVNLLIHLLNGLLLWRVLLKLLLIWRGQQQLQLTDESRLRLVALGVTAAWLLAPINLSAVLYIAQRMESMAQLFVLGGFWLYLHGREHMLRGAIGSGVALCAAGLAGGSAIGLLSKESSVLLPVYTLLAEWALLRFASPTRSGWRALWITYGLLLLLPAALGLAWLLPRTIFGNAYSGRPFNLEQRLLTETRVLVDYIRWTLLPYPGGLSFYHDDIPLSQGWLNPWTTLASTALLAAGIAAAALLRRCLPLFALGIGWYFAAHLLTATVIPLELVFEHRNYFASAGLLLAGASLLLALPPGQGWLRKALPVLGLALFAVVTRIRSEEWSHPIKFAYAEAVRHPGSARANIELGQTLAAASHYRADSKLIDPAMTAFERAAALPDSSIGPLSGLIIVASHMHRRIDPEWWTRMAEKLQAQPPSAESVTALEALSDCQRKQECPPQTEELLNAYLAALDHPPPSGRLLASYGTFAANMLGDYPTAERALADALNLLPTVNGIRFNLVKVMLLQNQFALAAKVLDGQDTKSSGPDDSGQAQRLRQVIDSHSN